MVRRQSGFTYLAILMAIAMMGIMLAAAGIVWSTHRQREREQELLFAGSAIRNAIRRYYFSPGAGVRQLPQSLHDLVEDRRSPTTQHYLRRLYRDPMMDTTDWQLVLAADGGIMGVYSASQAAPLKRTNFKIADSGFADAQCYCDWKFVFMLRGRPPAAIPSK